jgi:RNA polymerase sigma-70 factor (ECF subfamily)
VAQTVTAERLLSPLVAPAASVRLERRAVGLSEADREAIEACQRGDKEAFDGLMERYHRDVYRLCFRFAGNHEDANDLTQETFIKAYRALPRFRGDSAFPTWVYRIAVNTCLNFKASRRPEGELLEETLPDERPGMDQALLRRDEAKRVRAAIQKLPEKQRATLILKTYHDLTHEEVARAMGATVGTTKANFFHALGNLKRILGGERR